MKVIDRAKGTIRFSFKKPLKYLSKNPNEQSLILLHYSYGSKRFKYSTGYSCCFNDWDILKHRVRNKAHILNRTEINDYLNHLELELGREVSRLVSIGQSIEVEYLKSWLDKLTNRTAEETADEEINLYKYCEVFINRKKGKIQDVTLRSYSQTIKLLKRFNPNLDFEDIDYEFHRDFVRFLEEDEKSLNTIAKHFKNLKVILGSATKDGFNTNLKYLSVDFKIGTEQTTEIYLDEEEINKLFHLDLSGYPKLERAKDIFLIGCYTGQRISDYNGLTVKDICVIEGVPFFKIRQKKTGREVYCPITKEIRKIMDAPRNGGKPPPRMNEQEINNCIKEVGRKAKIDEPIINRFTKGGRRFEESLPKHMMISSHTARRSFCTNMYKKGMSTYEIMQFSGHTTEREFYKYIRIEREQKALQIAKKGFFNL